jgi:hypothetical protein
MRAISALVALTALGLASTTASGRVWQILPNGSGDAPTIAAGLDSAISGDTVLVACGTYHEREIHLKSGVCLASQTRDWSCVTIEGDFLGAVLVGLWETVTDTTEIVGLTITEGFRGSFGGVVLDCGGLVHFRNCRITANVGDGVYGSTSLSWQSNVRFDSCEVSQNGGTGVSFESGDVDSKHSFYDCDIRSNQTGVKFMWEGYDPELHRCRITDNADAGVRCWMADPLFEKCLIARNGGDGIIADDSADLALWECTVAKNGGDGIGLVMEMGYCQGSLVRSLVAFNGGNAVACGDSSGPSSAYLTCCDVFGNALGDYVDMPDLPCLGGFLGIDGNLWVDPLFCDTAAGDFRIDCSSPCVDVLGCGQVGAFGAGCNVTGIVQAADVSRSYGLSANWPNPFNPSTSIRFAVPERAVVDLTLYDTAGRRVAVLASGVYDAGDHVISWNGQDDAGREVPSGTYFARLHAGEYGATRKLVLIK